MEDHGPHRELTPKREQVRSRLARAHGHLHGVLDMIDDDRSDAEILHQVNAVRAALARATTMILDEIMERAQKGDAATQRDAIQSIRAAVHTLA